MKKIAIIAALLVFVVGSYGLFSLIQHQSHYEQCVTKYNKQIQQTPFEESPSVFFVCAASFIEIHSGLVTALATAIIAIFTLVLGVATYLIWKSGEKQLTHARESGERQLRAYVFIETVGAKIINNGNGANVEVQVTIKNSGITPAYEFMCWIGVAIENFPEAELPAPPKDFQMTNAILSPGGLFNLRGEGMIDVLSIGEVTESRKAIYSFGEIKYLDAFGRAWCASFRLQCKGRDFDNGVFRYCLQGNGESRKQEQDA